MNDIKLYYDTMSQPSRALKLLLLVNKIPHESIEVNLAKGEHLQPDYEKINPFRKVPAINHKGFCLSESVAIVRYLSRELDLPEHWYPRDSKRQGRVDEYLEWQHNNTRIFCAMYFQQKMLMPLLTGKPEDKRMVSFFQKGMEKVLDTINDTWLSQHKYLCGDEISVADLFAVCELEQPRLAGYDVGKGRPRLQAYMERVRCDLQPHYNVIMTRFERFIARYGHFSAKL